MKKLFIVNNVFSAAAQYGIKTFIRELLGSIADTEYSVTVVDLCSNCRDIESETLEGIQYLRIPTIPNLSKNNDRYCRNVAYILATYVKQEDEVIFHFNYLHHRMIAHTLKQILPQSKQILTIHYWEWIFRLKGNEEEFRRIVCQKACTTKEEKDTYKEYLQDKEFFHTVDKVIVLCKDTWNLMRDVYQVPESKLAHISNGLTDVYTPLDESTRESLRKEFGFEAQDKLILSVGRISELKGIGLLIEAVRPLIDQNPNIHLILAGSGEDEKRYKKEILGYWKNIHFVGQLEQETIYKLYQIADLGAFLSSYEQFGYVAIEMMMFGLPFIALTSKGGLKEIFETVGINTYSIENKNISLLHKQIQDALLLSNKVQEKFRESFLHHFQNKNMKKYTSVYS